MKDVNINFYSDSKLLSNYLNHLVDRFFKILPMREQDNDSLPIYTKSLLLELLGSKKIISEFNNDGSFVVLISILQYLSDHPDCAVSVVRREVFRAISICNKLQQTYIQQEGYV